MSKLKAKNNYILLIKNEVTVKMGNLMIPDNIQKRAQSGKIFSVGKTRQDISIVPEETAFFHPTAGFELDVDGEMIFVLRDQDVIACK